MFAEDYDSDDEVVSEPKHEHQPAEPSGKLEAASIVQHVPRAIERIMVSEMIFDPAYSFKTH